MIQAKNLFYINKYSFVNSKFVKDFYNIIKEDYIERYNEFLINSEILRKWLEIKRSYKKTLGSGGHNLEVIALTLEAAKKYAYQLIIRW